MLRKTELVIGVVVLVIGCVMVGADLVSLIDNNRDFTGGIYPVLVGALLLCGFVTIPTTLVHFAILIGMNDFDRACRYVERIDWMWGTSFLYRRLRHSASCVRFNQLCRAGRFLDAFSWAREHGCEDLREDIAIQTYEQILNTDPEAAFGIARKFNLGEDRLKVSAQKALEKAVTGRYLGWIETYCEYVDETMRLELFKKIREEYPRNAVDVGKRMNIADDLIREAAQARFQNLMQEKRFYDALEWAMGQDLSKEEVWEATVAFLPEFMLQVCEQRR